ncbi:MAG: LTA synthase family protein, partial [Candidatus Scalindua sp.]|nr:LTA synthase family protein [Candidatus Scalindua sp.]MCR4345143.1 LTA synthase family protein [Candidatus Scalindua sp.]
MNWFYSLGPLALLAPYLLSVILVFTVFRIILILVHFKRVKEEEKLYNCFVQGLRMDCMVSSYFCVVPLLLVLILPSPFHLPVTFILKFYFCATFAFALFMEIATFPFIEEYDLRPDSVFIEYLKHPREVMKTVWAESKVVLLLQGPCMIVVFIILWKVFGSLFDNYQPWKWWIPICSFPLFAGILIMGIRSSIGHRPANISSFSFSNNHLVNELTLNSTYTLFYAIYRRYKLEKNPSRIYGSMAEDEVFDRVQKHSGIDEASIVNSSIPFSHLQTSPYQRERPMNIVVIVEESLGAEYVGVLGGLPLTPCFDELSKEGMLLTGLYSTGTRTVSALEALVSGFLPTCGKSVVKLENSKRDFFNVGALLAKHGYIPDFIYGGMSNFDEMRSFFLGNGFHNIYDEPTFENPAFHGVWGVSDEDLLLKAHEIFLSHGDRPFVSILLSTSNHSPFEFPEGRIELYEQPTKTRHNAMKYADYALGEFFKVARNAPYYKNTIFLIVADHDTRVRGNQLVPLDRFRIPGLIIGPDVPVCKYEKVASQLDLLPTILHFSGVDTIHPMIGRNLMETGDEEPGHAFMQYGLHNAYRVGNDVIIRLPESEPKQFSCENDKLIPKKLDEEMAKDSLAHCLLPWILYSKKLYKVPDPYRIP